MSSHQRAAGIWKLTTPSQSSICAVRDDVAGLVAAVGQWLTTIPSLSSAARYSEPVPRAVGVPLAVAGEHADVGRDARERMGHADVPICGEHQAVVVVQAAERGGVAVVGGASLLGEVPEDATQERQVVAQWRKWRRPVKTMSRPPRDRGDDVLVAA